MRSAAAPATPARRRSRIWPAHEFSIANCGTVVVKKVTKDAAGNVITNDSTSFGFSRRQSLPGPTPVADFNLTGQPTASADTKTISSAKPSTGLTVTDKTPIPSPYALVDIGCVKGGSATGTKDVANRVITFNLAAGETVTCTFTNQKQVQPSTIATAQTVYRNDSATTTGTTGDVTFELFGPFADAASVVCTGTAKFTQTVSQTSHVATTTNYPGVSGVTAYGVVNGADR